MPYRPWKFLAAIGAIASLASCTSSPPPNGTTSTPDKPTVVATTTVLCDMVKTIAQDSVNLTCLLKPGVDSHVYEPVPDDRKAIETAQLIFYSGYNLESGLIKLIQSTSNPAPKVAVAEAAVPQPLRGTSHHHGDAHAAESHTEDAHGDEAHGDEAHGDEAHAGESPDRGEKAATEPDPHVWQNAENGAQMVAVVEKNLSTLLPANRDRYAQNATALKAELQEIHAWIKAQIATIPTSARTLVTTHDAMAYYSAAYGIPVEGALQGLSTDQKPTAARVKTLVDEVRSSNVPTIFAEVVVNPKLIQTVAREADVKVADNPLYSDSLGETGSAGDTYPKMLIANTKAIVEGLNGKYVAFQPK